MNAQNAVDRSPDEWTFFVFRTKCRGDWIFVFRGKENRCEKEKLRGLSAVVSVPAPAFYEGGGNRRSFPAELRFLWQQRVLGLKDAQLDICGSGAMTDYTANLSSSMIYNVYLSSSADGGVTAVRKVDSFEYYVAYKPGFVNDDGVIDSLDTTYVLLHAAHSVPLDESHQSLADVDEDDSISGDDRSPWALLWIQVESASQLELFHHTGTGAFPALFEIYGI